MNPISNCICYLAMSCQCQGLVQLHITLKVSCNRLQYIVVREHGTHKAKGKCVLRVSCNCSSVTMIRCLFSCFVMSLWSCHTTPVPCHGIQLPATSLSSKHSTSLLLHLPTPVSVVHIFIPCILTWMIFPVFVRVNFLISPSEKLHVIVVYQII